MLHFLSFYSSWIYVTSCFTDHYFYLFWRKRSIQNWAIFFVLKSATIIFKFITLTVKKWKFALYIKSEMPLLCNEDDSLVANVFDAYVRKPQAELLYYLKWIHESITYIVLWQYLVTKQTSVWLSVWSLQDIDYPLFPWIYIHPKKSIKTNMNTLNSQFLRYMFRYTS